MNIRPTYLDNEFRHAFRNLSMPDRTLGLNPEKWVKYLKRAGATVAFMDFRSQFYANHPSDFIPKDPVLGKRDLAQEFADACQKNKIKCCAYIPPCSVESLEHGHDDWQQRTPDGGKECRNWGHWRTVFCYNTGFGELYANHLAEVARKYKVKGFFIDGVIYGFGACYCETCRAMFRKETGQEMPEKPDWSSKIWHQYIAWRYRQVENIGKLIGDAVHGVDPKIAVVWNCGYMGTGWYGGSTPAQAKWMDFPCIERLPTGGWVDFPGYTYGESLAWEITTNRGMRFGQPTQHYSYFTPATRQAEIIATANIACAFGAQGCPQEHSRYTGEYYDRFKKAEPWMIDAVSANDIAVHYSVLGQNAYYRPNGHGDINEATTDCRGVYKALLNAQLPAEVINDEWIETESISNFRAVVLPNSVCLRPEATAALQQYVQGGGTLIATMETGRLDNMGNPISDELLWKGSGLKFVRKIENLPVQTGTWYPDKMPDVEHDCSSSPDQFLMFGKVATMKAWIGEDITLPNRHDGFERREISQFHETPSVHVSAKGAAIVQADKAQWKTLLEMRYREDKAKGFQSTPSVLIRKMGKGRIIYVNFHLGQQAAKYTGMCGSASGHPWWRHFVKHLVEVAAGQPRVAIEAPTCIKAGFWNQPAKNRYALHLVNELSSTGVIGVQREDLIPVPAKVTINMPGVKKVKVVIGAKTPGAKGATVKKTGKSFIVTLPAVKERAVIELTC